jgi:hypothetical protein
MPDNFHCLRFNGVANQSHELFVATSTFDYFNMKVVHSYNESISKNEHFKFSLYWPTFYVDIGDNSLNSFEKIDSIMLQLSSNHEIEIEKSLIEIKLPYNQCKESSVNEPNHQSDCITSCIYRRVKDIYNCTFHLSLFTVPGLDQCYKYLYGNLREEFAASCLKECPLESDYSEKFTPSILSYKNFNPYTNFYFSFGDFDSLNITQIPKTDGFTFINNIGGGLGLFMGLAFPHSIEFLAFVVDIFSIFLIP